REVPGNHVDDARRHEERRDPPRPGLGELRVVRLDRVHAADTGPDRDAVAMRVGLLPLDAGIADRLHPRPKAAEHVRIALAGFYRLEVSGRVEVANRSGEARRERAHVVLIDRRDPADSVADALPPLRDAVAAGRNEAETRDYDASLRHGRCLGRRAGG